MMTEDPWDEHAMEDERFDRLVDGELSRDEYDQLLSSLDEKPGGWRRCALAFLEAQALRKELLPPAGETVDFPVTFPKHSSNRLPGARLRLSLAVAAIILLAFGLGLTQRGWWPESEEVVLSNPQLVDHQQDRPPDIGREQPGVSMWVSDHSVRNGEVRAVADGLDGVVPSNTQDGIWKRDARSGIPERISEMFERLGHDVQRRIRYVPVELSDSRQMLIPIEDVEIVPVSQESFQ